MATPTNTTEYIQILQNHILALEKQLYDAKMFPCRPPPPRPTFGTSASSLGPAPAPFSSGFDVPFGAPAPFSSSAGASSTPSGFGAPASNPFWQAPAPSAFGTTANPVMPTCLSCQKPHFGFCDIPPYDVCPKCRGKRHIGVDCDCPKIEFADRLARLEELVSTLVANVCQGVPKDVAKPSKEPSQQEI